MVIIPSVGKGIGKPALKSETDSNILIEVDFNTSFTSVGKSSRQKTRKET